MYHLAPESPECTVGIPLPTLRLPATMKVMAVLDRGTRALVMVKDGNLDIVDVASRRTQRCGRLDDNHSQGYDACQTAEGRVLVIGGYLGITEVAGASEADASEEPGAVASNIQARLAHLASYGANSVSAFGDTVAVSGQDLDRVDVFDSQGRLKRTIGPTFEYRGRSMGLAYGIDADERFPGASGVLVDTLERIWLALDGMRVAVFEGDGRCVYVSDPDELAHPPDEGMSVRLFHTYYGSSAWGVDHRGWLWCHGGNAAFVIPELEIFAPALQSPESVPTGLEPEFARDAFNAGDGELGPA